MGPAEGQSSGLERQGRPQEVGLKGRGMATCRVLRSVCCSERPVRETSEHVSNRRDGVKPCRQGQEVRMALSSHGAEFIRDTEPHSALGGRVREGAHAARHVGRRRGVRWTVVYDGMNCGGRTPRSAPWPRRGEAGPRQRPQRTRHETDWAAHVYMELHWSSGAPRFILLRCRSRFITLNSLLRYSI